MPLPVLLLLGCLLMLAAGCAALLAHQRMARRSAVTLRLQRTSEPYLPPRHRQDQPTDRPSARSQARRRLERLCGFNEARRARYRLAFPRLLGLCGLIGLAVAYAAWRAVGPAGLAVTPVVPLGLTRLYYRRCDVRHTRLLFQQFPDALGMIVRAVRVGVPLSGGIGLIAEEAQMPTAGEFRQLSEEIAVGRSLPDALKSMSARNQLPEYRFFATALAMQSQTGGGLTETLETLADTIRKRVAARARGHALASEARASCYILAALPFVVGALLSVVNYSYMSVLFHTAAGQKMLGAAALLLATGIFVMRSITNKSLA